MRTIKSSTILSGAILSAFTLANLISIEETLADSSTAVDTVEQFFAEDGRVVTEASYPTDETSRQLLLKQDKFGMNTFAHNRKLTPTDEQPIVRMNRDTYYSFAVVDVSSGATITMPDVGEGKYLSVQPVTEDHRIQPMFYGSGTFELSTHTGTHLYIVVRLDSTFSEADAAKLQDQMKIDAGSSNRFTTEPVNEESFDAVENVLKAKLPAIIERDAERALAGMFTAPGDSSNDMFTEEKYSVGAAVGWGGAQWNDNIYELSGDYPDDVCHQATFEDPENDAFWSITVYSQKGFMFNDVANVNSNQATTNEDGTYTVSFGCGADAPNNIETENESGAFTLAVRHYRPSKRVSEDGYRVLPKIVAVE